MAHAVESKPCTVLQSQDMIVHGRDLRALPQTKKVPHQHKQVGSISAKIIVRRLDGRMAFVPEGQRDRIARARQSAKRASFETAPLGFLRLRVGNPLARPWRQEIDYHTLTITRRRRILTDAMRPNRRLPDKIAGNSAT